MELVLGVASYNDAIDLESQLKALEQAGARFVRKREIVVGHEQLIKNLA